MKIDRSILKQQLAADSRLQEEGLIENGYIDQKSASAQSDGTQPGIYFIHAKNEVEARKVLDALPLVKAKMATYGLRNVGQFLSGIKEV